MAGIHEDFSKKTESVGPSDRSFGLVFAAFFAIVGLLPLLHRRPVRLWALAVSCVFALVALIAPGVLSRLNRIWMRLAEVIGRITNPVITGLMFYLLFTPAALITRLFRKDRLRLIPDPAADTYWIPRQPPGPPAESMRNQF
jgi:Saxitoxin biosynthesis operon protein SxtJ